MPKAPDRSLSQGFSSSTTEGNLQVTDISNGPFVRPHLEALVGGLEFIRNPDNNYPIRGMLL